MPRRKTNWVALGTAGAVGAAAMYGVTRMNQQNGRADNTRQVMGNDPMQRAGEAIQSAHQESMESFQQALQNDEL